MQSNNEKKAHLRVVSNNQNREGVGEIESPAVSVPEGQYQVAFQYWWTGRIFGRAKKLALIFKIMDPGPYFGLELRRWYNIRRFIGTAGRNGGFQAGAHSHLVREYFGLIGHATRLDRIALSHYRNCVLVADVRTVKSDFEQRELSEKLGYSIIDRLVAVAAGQVRAEAA